MIRVLGLILMLGTGATLLFSFVRLYEDLVDGRLAHLSREDRIGLAARAGLLVLFFVGLYMFVSGLFPW